MLTLTDEIIENTISNTSGYIVATVADNLNLPVEYVSDQFLASKTFALLRNKETGYYWDSIAELLEMFTDEINNN
jgi:hypothetical protein